MASEMQTRAFALGVGAVYVLVGIVGFIPVFYSTVPASAPHVDVTASYGYLLGLFPVNALHDVVHIAVGVSGIVCARRFVTARLFARTLFMVYGLLAVMGFIPTLETTFGLIPVFGSDIILHAATALAAGIVGFVIAEENVGPELGTQH